MQAMRSGLNGRRSVCLARKPSRARVCRPLAQRTAAEELKKREEDRVKLRSEAEAPFRALRLVLYGVSVVSASIATLISLPQLIGSLGGAAGALATEQVGQNLAINIGAITVFGYLFKGDWEARSKQLTRLGREEKLAALGLQLANGKRIPIRALQDSARVVIIAGTEAQVAASLEAAEPYKEKLAKAGVFVVTAPIFEDAGAAASASSGSGEASSSGPASVPELGAGDLRWRGKAVGLDTWREWFAAQLAVTRTNVSSSEGLFVGLRLDGRVRSSGKGSPPWARFALELGPMTGNAMVDGFDGDMGVR